MANKINKEEKAVIAAELQEFASKKGLPVMVFTSMTELILAADNMTLGANLKAEIIKHTVMACQKSPSRRVH